MRDVRIGAINSPDDYAKPARPLGALAWSALLLSLLSLPSLVPYRWADPSVTLMLLRFGVVALVLGIIAVVGRSRPRGVALAGLCISGFVVLFVVLSAGPLGFLRALITF